MKIERKVQRWPVLLFSLDSFVWSLYLSFLVVTQQGGSIVLPPVHLILSDFFLIVSLDVKGIEEYNHSRFVVVCLIVSPYLMIVFV